LNNLPEVVDEVGCDLATSAQHIDKILKKQTRKATFVLNILKFNLKHKNFKFYFICFIKKLI
jgi:hypothetical protein